jgi:hypothetical protein
LIFYSGSDNVPNYPPRFSETCFIVSGVKTLFSRQLGNLIFQPISTKNQIAAAAYFTIFARLLSLHKSR